MIADQEASSWDEYFARAGRAALASRAPHGDVEYLARGEVELQEILNYVQAPMRGRALEIGAGDGRITATLVRTFDSVIAQDVAPSILDACRETLRGFRNVEYALGNVEALEKYPDEFLDFVISVTVFQHIPSCEIVRSYIHEASRLLRPGGVAALQLRNPRFLTRLRDLAVDSARLPSRVPSFKRNWRGCRLGRADALQAGARHDRDLEWRPNRHFAWLVIRNTRDR